jgi:DNA-binding MarR family transcriptional regulator
MKKKIELLEIELLRSDIIFPKTVAIQSYMALRRAHDAIHRHVSKKLAQWKLSVPKYGVLVRLYDHDSLPLSELSNQIFRGSSNITTLIHRMEREGLVQRFGHEHDRRVKEVSLTKKGKELASRVIGEYKPFLHQMMMKGLTPEEQEIFLQCLNRVKASLGNLPEEK